MVELCPRVLTVLILLLTSQIGLPEPISCVNRQCKELTDQLIGEEALRMSYKGSILSAMAYLEYEKDASRQPWQVNFETARPRTVISSIKFSLSRHVCLVKGIIIRGTSALLHLFQRISKMRKSSLERTGGHDTCPTIDTEQDPIEFRWFFADWREGIWHDTEVLLGESKTTAVIVFRGSDSAADLFTNSQTMEPAAHSYYFGAQEGSLHRGMLNAYGRVDKGRLYPLNRGEDGDSAFGTHIGATYERFKSMQRTSNSSDSPHGNSDKIKYKKNAELHLEDVDSTHGARKKGKKSDKVVTDESVLVSDTLLSSLLINSVLSALRTGKIVILTGHSLGGSLALLLALDIAVNHVESESTDTCSRHNRKKETTESEISTYILTEDIDEKGEKIKEDMNVTQDAVRKRDLQCGSYNHHRGRRCTDVAEPMLLNQMHVFTFGQPDLASSSFFESVKAGSQTARSLLEERYVRVVSLSSAPGCEPDIVTQLVEKVGDVIGDWLSGAKKSILGREILDSVERSRTTRRHDTAGDIKKRNKAKSKIGRKDSVKTAEESPPMSRGTDIKTVPDEKDAQTIGDSKKSKKNQKKRRSYFGSKDRPNGDRNRSSEESENRATREDSRHDGAGRKIFVCSGASKDNIEAHSMSHYVYGLQYMSRTYDRRTGKADSACGKYRKSKRRRMKEFLYTKMSNKKADRFADDVNAEREGSTEEKKIGKVFTVRAGSTQVDARGRDTRRKVNSASSPSSSSSGSNYKNSHDRKKAAKNDEKKREYSHNNYLKNSTSKKKKKNLNRNSTEQSTDVQQKKQNSKNIPTEGFHLATDLRLDSALILKLLSLEKIDHATSGDQKQFYSFV